MAHNPLLSIERGAAALDALPFEEASASAKVAQTDPPKKIEPDDAAIDAAVARLEKLRPVKFERACKEEAVKLGCTVDALKREVKIARGEDENTGSGRPFEIENPDPWPDPVNGAVLLDELAATFRRFVVLPEHGDTIAALWTLHTYAFELGHITPILVIYSPDKGCGKTTLRDVLATVVRSALSTDGISAAALFRVIEKWKPTVLLDDFDSWAKENDELRGVLNTGYRKGGVYVRCVGDDSEPRGFATFAPKAINLIGRLHPTLHDRAVVIAMRRKLRGEVVASLHSFNGEELRRKCARWVKDNAARIESVSPPMPEGLFNRQADNWRPLLALAEVAAGNWPEKTKQAVLAAVNTDTDNESLGAMLLADIRFVFEAKNTDRLRTEDLLEALRGIEERPWPEYSHGKPITARQVAKLLKPFDVTPKTLRVQDARGKGYEQEQFADAFARYIPNEIGDSVTTRENKVFPDKAIRDTGKLVTEEKSREHRENKSCHRVTDGEPQNDTWETEL